MRLVIAAVRLGRFEERAEKTIQRMEVRATETSRVIILDRRVTGSLFFERLARDVQKKLERVFRGRNRGLVSN